MDEREARRMLRIIDKALDRIYGPSQQVEADDPLDELIYTILSQSTNDHNSQRAYEAMRAAFPTWQEVMCAPVAQLAEALRPGGLAQTKSVRIQRLLETVASRGRMSLDYLGALSDAQAEEELLRFDGVGRKTARCVLLFSLGRDVFPMDTHILRILRRVGLLAERTAPEAAHKQVQALIARGRCYALHVNLIAHGRYVCHARDPECHRCTIRAHCLYGSAVKHGGAAGSHAHRPSRGEEHKRGYAVHAHRPPGRGKGKRSQEVKS